MLSFTRRSLNGLFPSVFPIKILCLLLMYPVRDTRLVHFILRAYGEDYKL